MMQNILATDDSCVHLQRLGNGPRNHDLSIQAAASAKQSWRNSRALLIVAGQAGRPAKSTDMFLRVTGCASSLRSHHISRMTSDSIPIRAASEGASASLIEINVTLIA
jgi:hypothetical protein